MSDIVTQPNEPTAAAWFKCSHSGGESNECVEIANHRRHMITVGQAPGLFTAPAQRCEGRQASPSDQIRDQICIKMPGLPS
ncbi:DUF397 domain-containing protein [Streptomyces luteogriseus]|uniref:DUF397 domain-containing protein n=1 Tax=Streptomyces luteogriseus TaxID=68233 RepID=UPI003791516D